MNKTNTDVVIAGGGPTGLLLACELRLAGVDVVVLDRLRGRTGESRAGGMHPRTMELLDQRGILDRFRTLGKPLQVGHFSGLFLDFSELPTRYPFTLSLLQYRTEALLEQRLEELGARVRWSAGVTGIDEDSDGVTVELETGDRLRATYLVGCDGGHSTVRHLAGIDFPGTPATVTSMLADVELAEPPAEPIFMRRSEFGDFGAFSFEPGWWRLMTDQYDRVADRSAPVSFDEFRETFTRIAGTGFGMHGPRWVTRFADAARQASEYRRGRVLLAGDAAHIHFPAGGQGMNLGLQDAMNLGWKLAGVVRNGMSERLLDTYQAERHPVAERVLENTRAQTELARCDEHTTALRNVFRRIMDLPQVNEQLSGMISALDLRYPLGDGHPLVGRRVPDLDLKTDDGERRMFSLLHEARPVLLNLSGATGLGAGLPEPVRVVDARCDRDGWDVPMLGEVTLPAALLVRPDGYVAWAGTDRGTLADALEQWF